MINEVKQEVIAAFFDRYYNNKSTDDYITNFNEEQPGLAVLSHLLSEEFLSQFRQIKNKKQAEKFVTSQVFGIMVTMYALLKEQEQIDELETLYA